jgi:hypothetical protein
MIISNLIDEVLTELNLVKGCGPYLRGPDKFVIWNHSITEIVSTDADEWLSTHRPDLGTSAKEVHSKLATCRWLDINFAGDTVVLERQDGDDTSYVLDWMTVEVIAEDKRPNEIGGTITTGIYLQEYRLIDLSGVIFSTGEKRILTCSNGNYSSGNYRNVETINTLSCSI